MKKYVELILMIGLLLFVGFWHKELLKDHILDSDDYRHHAARTANYALALRQGQFPVRWAPNLNDGYGYPSFNYTYPIPYLTASLFHFSGASVQQSVNFAVLSAVLLGAAGCFLLIKFITKSNLAATIGALVYSLSPYPLLNVFWRGAIGEIFFIAMVPFLFLGTIASLQATSKTKKLGALLLVSLTTALLILSHFPSLLILFPAILLLIWLLVRKSQIRLTIKVLMPLLSAALLGTLMSAWYWLPALVERKFITYDSGASLKQYLNQFVSLQSLLDIGRTIQIDAYFKNVIQIGAGSLIILILAVFTLYKNRFCKNSISKDHFKNKKNNYLIWGITVFIGSLLLMTPAAKFIWERVMVVQLLQFPWRILWLAALAASILFGVSILFYSKWQRIFISVIVAALIVWSAVSYAQPKGYFSRSDFDWYQMSVTGSSFDEHQPIWSQKPYYFPEELMYFKSANLPLEEKPESNEQLAQLVFPLTELNPNISRLDGTMIDYRLQTNQPIVVLHKRLYFPGWELTVNSQPTEPDLNIKPYQGLLAVELPQGSHNIKLHFSGKTNIRKVGEIISAMAFLCFAFGVLQLLRNYFVSSQTVD